MKLLFLIGLVFVAKISIAQDASEKEIKESRKPSPSAFYKDYKNDTSVNRYISLSPEMIFKRSATIFDMTKIVLFRDRTFYCYTHGCLREGSSAGNYIINNDTLVLTSSNKVFKKLKRNSDFKGLQFAFVELNDLKFLIRKEELLAIK